MIKTEAIKDVVATLNINATKISDFITEEFANNSDARSSHTWHGLPESIIEEIESANGILALVLTRLNIAKTQY